MRVFQVMLNIGLSLLASACLMGDAAIKVKGRFVDPDNNPYSDCVLKATYLGRVIEVSEVEGEFQETIVFSPTSQASLILTGMCAGAQYGYEKAIDRMPKDLKPIDLGDIVLQKK